MNTNFTVIGLTRLGIKPGSAVPEADITESYENIHNKLYTFAIALDIKKAFDSVNHSILLKKLSHYGIRGVSHQLFESYLLNRKQNVSINDKISPMQK